MTQQTTPSTEPDLADSGATGSRGYNSPLRRAQADQTRTLIIEAVTDLLADRPSDEISTKDVAVRAGVSERTIYRHFADRREMHEALSRHWLDEAGPFLDDADDLADLAEMTEVAYAAFEAQPRGTIASVVINADPRRRATDTVRRSEQWVELTSRSFPDLDERQCVGLAAITRLLGSSQTWLRLREEFDIRGEEAGALASWALRALVNDARHGNPPPTA